MAVSPFAIDMYLPAFPQIATDFGTTPSRISWSVASYFVGLAVGQILYGPLLDRYGRKRPLYSGLILFMISCLGCMESHSVGALVAFRFTQALGGCVAWVGAMSMVRDFFPVREGAKVFSLLILVLGLSPLLAPTIGGIVTVAWGWQWIFLILMGIAGMILLAVFLWLPEGHQPDPTVSLRLGPMFTTFVSIYKTPAFYTYALAGSLAFATLFVYVSGSPVMFMEIYKIDPRTYGLIFAGISVGFVGASQFNIYLIQRFTSSLIFKRTLMILVIIGILFVVAAKWWSPVELTIALIFFSMACVGILNPNASTLALAPFSKNTGSAAALAGSTQITIASIVAGIVGTFGTESVLPFAILMSLSSITSMVVLTVGKMRIPKDESTL